MPHQDLDEVPCFVALNLLQRIFADMNPAVASPDRRPQRSCCVATRDIARREPPALVALVLCGVSLFHSAAAGPAFVPTAVGLWPCAQPPHGPMCFAGAMTGIGMAGPAPGATARLRQRLELAYPPVRREVTALRMQVEALAAIRGMVRNLLLPAGGRGQSQRRAIKLRAPASLANSNRGGARHGDPGGPGQLQQLLTNFQQIFLVSDEWIERFALALRDKDKKMFVFFVDLDNVPRFFKTFTLQMFLQIEQRLCCNTFVVCSSCQRFQGKRVSTFSAEELNRVHFTLANAHKDSADAVCTVAHAKLDSILIAFGRQQDARTIICSEDKIFRQVDDLLRRGSSHSAVADKRLVDKGLNLWECGCGKRFSSARAIDQHQAASRNSKCLTKCSVPSAATTGPRRIGTQRLQGIGETLRRVKPTLSRTFWRRTRLVSSAAATAQGEGAGTKAARNNTVMRTRPLGQRQQRTRSPEDSSLRGDGREPANGGHGAMHGIKRAESIGGKAHTQGRSRASGPVSDQDSPIEATLRVIDAWVCSSIGRFP